jgi:hypothetical protein
MARENASEPRPRVTTGSEISIAFRPTLLRLQPCWGLRAIWNLASTVRRIERLIFRLCVGCRSV